MKSVGEHPAQFLLLAAMPFSLEVWDFLAAREKSNHVGIQMTKLVLLLLRCCRILSLCEVQ